NCLKYMVFTWVKSLVLGLESLVLEKTWQSILKPKTQDQKPKASNTNSILPATCNIPLLASTDGASSRAVVFYPANTDLRVSSSPTTSCKPLATLPCRQIYHLRCLFLRPLELERPGASSACRKSDQGEPGKSCFDGHRHPSTRCAKCRHH